MKFEVDIDITPLEFARAFLDMNDEEQAAVLLAVAADIKTWSAAERFMQFSAVGRHLKTCECSSPDARTTVREMLETIIENLRRRED